MPTEVPIFRSPVIAPTRKIVTIDATMRQDIALYKALDFDSYISCVSSFQEIYARHTTTN